VRLTLALAVLAVVVAGACGSIRDLVGVEIDARDTWYALEIGGRPVPPGSTTLSVGDDAISADAGCNSMFGSITKGSGDRVRFRDLGQTDVLCEDEDGGQSVMEREIALVQALGRTEAWTLDSGRLVLLDAARAPLAVFERATLP
jgi:heat shock protein HslJ